VWYKRQDLKDFNKELEERILEANKDATKVKWNKLLPDLMAADVLMVGQFNEKTDAAGNRQLNILMMQKDGHIIVPFFTSPERISVMANADNGEFDVMKVNTVRFFQSIAGKPCVLDPLSDLTRVFTPFEMKILAAENIDKAPPLPRVN
ncbi:MAG: SseB family protein, partial [Oscillospiraceae bacterium]|nr:SseB family protein [Oscillospiraceae bacterium]